MTTFLVFAILSLLFHAKSVESKCSLAESCVSDLTQQDCAKGEYLISDGGINNCCPKCVKLSGIGEICSASRLCAPGLKCVERECVIDSESCFHTLHLPIEQVPYPPSCNPDGTYAAVQCKGDSLVGRCFCSDKRGKRIFGIAWFSEAEDMTCACSRKRSDLEETGRRDVTLHCASNGNYEPLQCDNGLCWCTNSTTGMPDSIVIPENLVSQLPCYDPDTFGSQYLRKCESKNYAVEVLKKKLIDHGTTQVAMTTLNCDYDGTYGVYAIQNGIAYCSWKDGGRLGVWQSDAGASLNDVNCNCARDTRYYTEVGLVMSQTCRGNGNYMSLQQVNGKSYCVDSDGFPITELHEPEDKLDCGDY